MWILRSTEPADLQLTFRLLPGEVRTLGRAAGAQFIVDAPLVSRLHCRLTLTPGGTLQVEDLGSTNGTIVNDRLIAGATPLAQGDMLRIGRVEFEVGRAGESQGGT